jgi:hypothetical protein
MTTASILAGGGPNPVFCINSLLAYTGRVDGGVDRVDLDLGLGTTPRRMIADISRSVKGLRLWGTNGSIPLVRQDPSADCIWS